MSTDLELSSLEMIACYSYRFKIEVAFRQALHTLGTHAHHFWMRAMTPHLSVGKPALPSKAWVESSAALRSHDLTLPDFA
jgi:hypothetical protein